MYTVKEIFLTLQGEGFHSGRRAVFCRFAGCNLWDGIEAHRARAVCRFCDTDFLGGDKYSAESLSAAICAAWGETHQKRFVVFTGGEPLLQLDDALISLMHSTGFEVAVETNGTVSPPVGIDWLTVSPKSTARLRVAGGDELKLVFPQFDAMPSQFESLHFAHFYLQPMASDRTVKNTAAAVEYCLGNPKWRLSTQMHKQVGIQ